MNGCGDTCRENGPDPNLGRGRRNAARAADTAEHAAAIAERKRKQDALSTKKNEETYKRLTAQVCAPRIDPAGVVAVNVCSCRGSVDILCADVDWSLLSRVESVCGCWCLESGASLRHMQGKAMPDHRCM